MLHRGIPGAIVVLSAGSAVATVLGVVSTSTMRSGTYQRPAEISQRVAFQGNYVSVTPVSVPTSASDYYRAMVTFGSLPDWLTSDTGEVRYPPRVAETSLIPELAPVADRAATATPETTSTFSAAGFAGPTGGVAYAYSAAKTLQQSSLAVDLSADDAQFSPARQYGSTAAFSGSGGRQRAAASPALASPRLDEPDPNTSLPNTAVPTPGAAAMAVGAISLGLLRRRGR